MSFYFPHALKIEISKTISKCPCGGLGIVERKEVLVYILSDPVTNLHLYIRIKWSSFRSDKIAIVHWSIM